MSPSISLKRRCELLGVVRSTVYYKPKKKKSAHRKLSLEGIEERMAVVDRIHTEMPTKGARKMARMLNRGGLPTTRYQAGKLMDMMNICCIYPKPNLSKPGKGHAKFPYLLKNKRIWLPNQVWAIDITYIPYRGSHMYLAAIIDWYSKMIVDRKLADSSSKTSLSWHALKTHLKTMAHLPP